MKKKNILLVHSMLHIGGAEEVSANLCKNIDRERFSISVCCLKERGVVADRIEKQGIPVFSISKRKSCKTDYWTSLKLLKLIREQSIHIVHSHDFHALLDCSICKILSPKLKFIHTYHYGNYPNRQKPIRYFEKLTWRIPDKLVAVSNNQKVNICDLYKIPDNRINTVWNGVDVDHQPEDFEIITKLRSQKRVIIGSINTLIEQKGMFDLIRVATCINQNIPGKFAFIVAGDGVLREKLIQEINAQGLQDVVFLLGWVNQASKVLLAHIDIFFQPSLWEAMSIVLLEAMASGKPIVTTRVGETPLVIIDGQHGYVVNAQDLDAMVKYLTMLILDPNMRSKFGVAAQQRYQECFTADMMTRRYAKIYESL